MRSHRLLVAAFLLLLPLTVFHRSLLRGEAFLPADLLRYVAPWKGVSAPPKTAWNVLRFDGIAQFYPWRLQAARAIRAGLLPLWNPYQFGAEGGTPLLANSQSAPLYPPNVLFYLLPTARAFGWSAALHLLIATAGTYLFARTLPVGRLPAILGAATFALCGPVTTWLALPTFLAVACWLPWLLLLIRRAHHEAGTATGRLAVVGVGCVAGLMLLAGHLQVAFYCLLAGGMYAIWQGARAVRTRHRPRFGPWLLGAGGAVLLMLLLAAPQLLPAVELARISHRAQTGPPAWSDYAPYVANALPPRYLVTLLAPDFFGHPNSGSYWGHPTVNYAEFAVYVGVLPLLLGIYALALPRRAFPSGEIASERVFFGCLTLLALLMALGTPVNTLFFFGVPGFAQTGSPARALLLVGFSLALLAALGLEALLERHPAGRRAPVLAIAVPTLLALFGISQIALSAGEVMAAAGTEVARAGVLLLIALALLLALPRLSGERARLAAGLVVGVTVVDLLAWGLGYNPSSPPEAVYPVTPGVRWLQQNGGTALIAPINRGWSLGATPPEAAVLPPNALTVYGLHDLSGYDSLFPGQAKRRVRAAAGGVDPSPPENGNIVFVKSVQTARALGARYLVAAPEAQAMLAAEPFLRPVYAGPDLVIYENPSGRDWKPAAPEYAPMPFRLGLFLGLCGLAGLATTVIVAPGTLRGRESKV